MELRHWRYFVAVAEELNFSHAAERLHVSQPPLSRQIHDLEVELGFPLFDRIKGKVRLTDAGQYLYGEAKKLLQTADQMVQEGQRIARSRAQRLLVGYVANVQGKLVIEAATQFRKVYPSVLVKVFDGTTAEQVRRLLAGKLDLGFVGFKEAPAQSGLHVEPIGATYAVMALPRNHHLARRKLPPLAAFKNESFITIDENAFPGARDYVIHFCAQAGFQPRIVHEAQQPIDIVNLVAIGEGVALVPEQVRHTPHDGVVFRTLGEPVPRVESYVAWREESTSELLLAFVRFAREAYPDSLLDGRQPGTSD